jgi:3-hydroxybutyryl-CoA dehydratase
MASKVIAHKIEDFSEGQRFTLEKTISESDVNDFAGLSGDISPLHMDNEFAEKRGFKGRLVHGTLVASYLSSIIGVQIVGENCLLQSMDLRFISPVYINDTLRITVSVDHISLSTNVVLLKILVESDSNNSTLIKGKIQIGFT